MRLDTILDPADSAELAAEVAALRTPGRVLARGIEVHHHGAARPTQFQVVVDEPGGAWTLDRQGDPYRERYADGVLHSVDGAHEFPFSRSGSSPVRMATPELLLLWGPPSSFVPVLAQRIGEHSLLFTFEHERDPALRPTLVVDERDGMARRLYEVDRATIVTEVRRMASDEPIPARPRFPKLTAPPPTDY